MFTLYDFLSSIEETKPRSHDNPWGVCPQCGGTDGVINIGRGHWFVCHEHKKIWFAGSNLFSTWKCESMDNWEANHEKTKEYEVISGSPQSEDIPIELIHKNFPLASYYEDECDCSSNELHNLFLFSAGLLSKEDANCIAIRTTE